MVDRLSDLVKKYSDIPRPIELAQVIDNSGWSATDAQSSLVVLHNGAYRSVLYRDGPKPNNGDNVQIIRMNHLSTSPWLCLPLAEAVPSCTYNWIFIINGSPADPPDQLPQDGSLAGTTIRAQFHLSADCRDVYVSLQTYDIDYSTGQVITLHQQDNLGPVNGPLTSYVQAQVNSYPTIQRYYVLASIGPTPQPVFPPGSIPHSGV